VNRWSDVSYAGCSRDGKLQRRRRLLAWRDGALELVVCGEDGERIAPADVDWRGCTPPTGRKPEGVLSREIPVLMRVSEPERALLEGAARSRGLPLTTWMREIALSTASTLVAERAAAAQDEARASE